MSDENIIIPDDEKSLEFLRNLSIPEYMYELSNKECVIFSFKMVI